MPENQIGQINSAELYSALRKVAGAIGPQTCWLVTAVASLQNINGGPAPLFIRQLMEISGIGNEARLFKIRDRAVKAGLLRYTRGVKGCPGKYWAVLPEASTAVLPVPAIAPQAVSGGAPVTLKIEARGRDGQVEQTIEVTVSR